MRKDMKLGLAVGGVLAMVVLVYAVLFSGSQDRNKKGTENNPAALGAGGGAIGGAGQNGAGASPSAGRAPVGNSAAQLGSGAGATGNSGQPAAGTPQAGIGSGTGSTAEPGPAAPPQQPNGWNWATALRTGSIAQTQTPDPNRAAQPDPPPRRPREGPPADPATRPADQDRDSVRRELPRRDPVEADTGPRKRVVKSGESYWTIAKDEYGSAVYVSHLIRANPGIDPKTLKAGATITIPPRSEVVPAGVTERALGGGTQPPAQIDPSRQYRVQAGDNLSVISRRLYGRTDKVEAIYELNKDVIGPNKSVLKRDIVLVLPEPPTTRQGG